MVEASHEPARWDTQMLHSGYENSVLRPPAPENATGEVLLASVSRRLITGTSEAEVDLSQIDELPRLFEEQASGLSRDGWRDLLRVTGGIGSPRLKGQKGSDALPQLSPYVPELSRYAGVLGRPRQRWNPSNVFVSAVGAGTRSASAGAELLVRVQDALSVGPDDDLLACFVEQELSLLRESGPLPELPALNGNLRREVTFGKGWVPAERFCEDLRHLCELKRRQTRAQWVTMAEALLRLGMTTHYMWWCHVNARLWEWLREIVEEGQSKELGLPTTEEVERRLWPINVSMSPLLELGSDCTPLIKRCLRQYYVARIGLSVLAEALAKVDPDVASRDGFLAPRPEDPDVSGSTLLLQTVHLVAKRAPELREHFSQSGEGLSLGSRVDRLADSASNLLRCREGSSRQAYFFLRYTMGQLQPREDELRPYDQAYLAYKKNNSNNSPWPIRPGPSMLLMMAHAAASRGGTGLESLDGFREYLGGYGIGAPAGELLRGATGQALERLGLSVESPDAGGGRLIRDPFEELV